MHVGLKRKLLHCCWDCVRFGRVFVWVSFDRTPLGFKCKRTLSSPGSASHLAVTYHYPNQKPVYHYLFLHSTASHKHLSALLPGHFSDLSSCFSSLSSLPKFQTSSIWTTEHPRRLLAPSLALSPHGSEVLWCYVLFWFYIFYICINFRVYMTMPFDCELPQHLFMPPPHSTVPGISAFPFFFFSFSFFKK